MWNSTKATAIETAIGRKMARMNRTVSLGIVLSFAAYHAPAAVIGPSLAARLSGAAPGADAGTVIVSFNTNSGLTASHLAALTSAGVTRAFTLQSLGMAAFSA